MVKSIWNKLIVTILIVVLLAVNVQNSNDNIVRAATNKENLAKYYLNATTKYLHLGDKEESTFDFDVKNISKVKGTSFTWDINKQKGNPNAVTINKKTGVVTANKIGTAYIFCKITKADGAVLKPEATVTVRNNITELEISNFYNHQTITTGKELKFDYSIVNTEAGSIAPSSDVVRWELQKNTAGAEADANGVVKVTKTGTFQIRAVSFQSNSKYNAWLKDNSRNENYITAASQWFTMMVDNAVKEAIVENQSQLDIALSNKNISIITIKTKEAVEFKISKGDYSEKSVYVNAPNADVNNEGTFKNIVIQAIKDSTWIEYANGNIIYLDDTQASIVIDKNSDIKEIVIDRPNSVMNIIADGNVNKITLLQPSQVTLTGKSENVSVAVEETAAGSNLASSVPMNLNVKADTTVALNEGAEGTTLNRSDKTIEVSVNNDTKSEVKLSTNNIPEQIVDAGKSAVSKVEKDGSKQTAKPTEKPTGKLTGKPTEKPTGKPTEKPSIVPTAIPTVSPVLAPPNPPSNVPETPQTPPIVIPPAATPVVTPVITPSQQSKDATLKTLRLGNQDVLSLSGIIISNPSTEAGAIKKVTTADHLTGMSVVTNDEHATYEVSVNNNKIASSKLDTTALAVNDVIIIKVTAQNSDIKYYKITIKLSNSNPKAVTDNVTLNEDDRIEFNPTDNDEDMDKDTLSITAYTKAGYGTVVINRNYITYTPSSNYNGEDTFTYTISDGQGGTSTGTIKVTIKPVNDNPIAKPDQCIVKGEKSVLIEVLSNDKDVDNDKLSISATTTAKHGKVQIEGNSIRYTPTEKNYTGSDSFEYTIRDGHEGKATSTVTVQYDSTPELSKDATLKSLILGDQNVLSLSGIVVSNPTVELGATKNIISTEKLTGITVVTNSEHAISEISLNSAQC